MPKRFKDKENARPPQRPEAGFGPLFDAVDQRFGMVLDPLASSNGAI